MSFRTSSLALSKTRLPPRPAELIRRPRLIEQLNAQREHRLFVMSAPAGYGKTSLLLDWAHTTDLSVAWYSLDSFDNTPHTFLAYLIESIRVHFPQFGVTARTTLEQSSEQLAALQSVVALIANELIALSQPLVIVLDDYHMIQNETIDQLVTLLLRYAGEKGHLWINSRTLVGLPEQALLRGRGLMGGLGVEELRFTTPEIQLLVEQNFGLSVPVARAEELIQITDGWITSLLLMGHHAGWRQLVEEALVLPSATEPVFDYLAEQLFIQQPEQVQRFWLGSSVLAPLAPEMLDQLPGLSHSKHYLERLHQQGLFVHYLSGPGDVYEYHPLLREFLQARLRATDPAWHAQLCERCAEMYAEDGQAERAVELYLSLGRIESAIQVVEATEGSLRTMGDIARMANWVQQIPSQVVSQHPRLLALQGKIQMQRGQLEQAADLFERAAHSLQRVGDYAAAADKRAWKGTVLRFLGQYRQSLAESKKINALVEHLTHPASETRVRALSLHLQGISEYYLGRRTKAKGNLERARDLFLTTEDTLSLANVLHDLGMTHRALGHLTTAIETYAQALAIWERLQSPSGAATTLNNLGYIYVLLGRMEDAEKVLRKALTQSRQGNWARSEASVLSTLGDLYRDLGEYPRALDLYAESAQLAQTKNDANLLFEIQWSTADVYRRQGEIARAKATVAALLKDVQTVKASPRTGQIHLLRGLIALDEGQSKTALTLMTSAAKQIAQTENRHLEALAEYYLAHLHLLRGHVQPATQHLMRTAKLIERLGYDYFLTIEGRHTNVTLEFASTVKSIGFRFKSILDQIHPLPAPTHQKNSKTAVGESFLTVYTLGQEQFRVNGVLVEQLRPQVREVFLFLLARLPQGVRKDELVELFWRDLENVQADQILWVTLTRIRKKLCPISLVNGWYVLTPKHLWYDVQEFEQGLRSARGATHVRSRIARLKQTLQLFQGDYLERLEALWVLEERERLRHTRLEALLELAAGYREVEDFPQALQTFEQVIELEPYLETAWYGAIEMNLQMGNRLSALARYEKLKALLQDEMGVEPSPELQSLYQDILNLKR